MTPARWTPDQQGMLREIQGAPDRARLPRTDYGNAQRLVAAHGEDLRHAPELGWYVWDGRCWVRDAAEVSRRAKGTARAIMDESAAFEDHDDRSRHTRWARTSESAVSLKNMVALAETERAVAIAASELDADPMLLCVANG